MTIAVLFGDLRNLSDDYVCSVCTHFPHLRRERQTPRTGNVMRFRLIWGRSAFGLRASVTFRD